jgi:hypothetical protein
MEYNRFLPALKNKPARGRLECMSSKDRGSLLAPVSAGRGGDGTGSGRFPRKTAVRWKARAPLFARRHLCDTNVTV